MRAGVSEQTIQAIQYNRDLKNLPAKDALMIRFGRALFREHKVSPELYADVVKTFGQRGTVEASWITGDYAMAAVALRAVDQRNPDGCVPSALNVPGAKYPCVYPDNRALFRVIAPDAGKIRVRVGAGFDMTKGPDDIWTVTISPLVSGFHLSRSTELRPYRRK